MTDIYKIEDNKLFLNINNLIEIISDIDNVIAFHIKGNKISIFIRKDLNYYKTKKILLDNLPFLRYMKLYNNESSKKLELTLSDNIIQI